MIRLPDVQMILQIPADPFQIDGHRNPQRLQLAPRTDPGQQHQLRRSDRSSRENHLARRAHLLPVPRLFLKKFDSSRPSAFDQHPRDLHLRPYRQIASSQRRFQNASAALQRAPFFCVTW